MNLIGGDGLMRVAFPMRVDAKAKPGGDVAQIDKYIEEGHRRNAIDGNGFVGEIIVGLDPDLSSFDLVHLTNIDRPIDTYKAFASAQRAKKPVVISTIHHSYKEIAVYEKHGRGGSGSFLTGAVGFRPIEVGRSFVRSRQYSGLASATCAVLLKGLREAQMSILEGAKRIIVLTEKERRDICEDIGHIDENKFVLLRNSADDIDVTSEALSERDIDLLMVGRIEARKNQIAVLRAAERIGLAVAFVGAENPFHRQYCEKFKNLLGDSSSTYLGMLSREETLQTMRRSKIHISASWFEVSSLVDLEAYRCGCQVVSSRCGGTQEILGEEAVYVDPGSEESIAEALAEARQRAARGYHLASKRSGVDSKGFQTWGQIANQLYKIYYECL